ncbi:MAG: adenosylmethionine--8-amino-7-oxononanoate transaminase, partial [bacterium]|nr:adenosylmethionine--8-amino-7-oxononanoate transaminase [bacterium]
MMEFRRIDLKNIWHPFTQMKEWNKYQLFIEKGDGIYLYDDKGRKYIDGNASLWVNTLGHNNKKLNKALSRQLNRIAHSTFLGLTHKPAVLLTKKLMSLLPKRLNRFFYSDNGSTAVEVALKLAYAYSIRVGKKVDAFIALKGAYHGDTIGSVSVGGISLFHSEFKGLLFKVYRAMAPNCLICPYRKKFFKYRVYEDGFTTRETGCRFECLNELKKIVKKYASKSCGFIMEPVVQAADGIIVHPKGYLERAYEILKENKLKIIFDEVATGFFRTGRCFAFEHEKAVPDFLCLAKSITGGYLPLAVTVTTYDVYSKFLGRFEEYKHFFHGHTYTANQLACSTAYENLKIITRNKFVKQLKEKISILQDFIRKVSYKKNIYHARSIGFMAAVELSSTVADIGYRVCLRLRKYGVLLRPLGRVLVIMPPYVISKSELEYLLGSIEKAID